MVDLIKNQSVRFQYLQVDSLNKCVPQDWFLGYDHFIVYSMLNLLKGSDDQQYFLSTYIRPE